MPGRGAGELAGPRVGGQIQQRDELPGGDLAEHDLVCSRQELVGPRVLAGQRAEDELRHRHVRRGVDPVPGDVAEDDRQASIRELEEVVDVAADLDERGGGVDGADLEPLQLRARAREEGALHRLHELLAFLVEPGVVECQCGLAGDGDRRLQRLAGDRPVGVEREHRQGPEDLGLGRERDDGRGRSLLEERNQRLVRSAERSRGRGVEHDRRAAAKDARLQRRDGLRQRQDLPHRPVQPLLLDVNCDRYELVAPPVRHPQGGCVDVEGLDDRPHDRFKRCIEREALGERA